jgi:hypothetical protein
MSWEFFDPSETVILSGGGAQFLGYQFKNLNAFQKLFKSLYGVTIPNYLPHLVHRPNFASNMEANSLEWPKFEAYGSRVSSDFFRIPPALCPANGLNDPRSSLRHASSHHR